MAFEKLLFAFFGGGLLSIIACELLEFRVRSDQSCSVKIVVLCRVLGIAGIYRKKILDFCGCDEHDEEVEIRATQLHEINVRVTETDTATSRSNDTLSPVREDRVLEDTVGLPECKESMASNRLIATSHLSTGIDRPSGSWY